MDRLPDNWLTQMPAAKRAAWATLYVRGLVLLDRANQLDKRFRSFEISDPEDVEAFAAHYEQSAGYAREIAEALTQVANIHEDTAALMRSRDTP